MMPLITWRTDEPCPACGAPLLLLDDGDGAGRAECGSCGYADTWTSTDRDARDDEHLGWGAR